jgi:hypothetical protein
MALLVRFSAAPCLSEVWLQPGANLLQVGEILKHCRLFSDQASSLQGRTLRRQAWLPLAAEVSDPSAGRQCRA